MAAPHPGHEALVELHRPSFLEYVDQRLGVGAEGKPRPRLRQPTGRANAIGEVALGRRTETDSAPSAPQQLEVAVGDVRGMDRREARREGACLGEYPGGAQAVCGEAVLVLGWLLGDVGVKRPGSLGCERRHLGGGLRVDGADAVDRGADPRPVTGLDLVHPLRPVLGAAIGEPKLDALRLPADPAVQVTGVEQGDANPGLASGGDHRLPQRVRVLIAGAARAVMQVVELAHGRDACQRHLPEGRPGQSEIVVGIDSVRDLIHPAIARSRSSRDRPGCARAGPAGRRASARWPFPGWSGRATGSPRGRALHPRGDRRDSLAIQLHHDARLGALAAQPRELAPEGACPFGAHELSSVSRSTRRTNSSR